MERQLLSKFLTGECSIEESIKVIAWSKSDDFKADLERLLELSWQEQSDENLEYNSEKMFEAIMSKAQATETQTVMQPKPKLWNWYKYAAAVVLILSLGWGWWKFDQDSPIVSSTAIQLNTSKGEKKTFLFSDGSEVMLNSNSTLNFDRNFTDSSRIIYLQGEAFFKVAKDSVKPFIVIADNIWTTALGTEFNVNTRGEIEVSLKEGKVMIHRYDVAQLNNINWVLNPGEKVTYDAEGDYFQAETFLPNQELAWTAGVLYFKNDRFDEVLNQLELWYDVSFTISNYPINKTYSGSFENESLDNVLKGMGFSLGFDYAIHDKTVLITGKP